MSTSTTRTLPARIELDDLHRKGQLTDEEYAARKIELDLADEKEKVRVLHEVLDEIYDYASKASIPSNIAGRTHTVRDLLRLIQNACIHAKAQTNTQQQNEDESDN